MNNSESNKQFSTSSFIKAWNRLMPPSVGLRVTWFSHIFPYSTTLSVICTCNAFILMGYFWNSYREFDWYHSQGSHSWLQGLSFQSTHAALFTHICILFGSWLPVVCRYFLKLSKHKCINDHTRALLIKAFSKSLNTKSNLILNL